METIIKILILYRKISELHLSLPQVVVILFSIFLILVSLFMGVVSFVVDKKRAVRYLFTLFASVGIMMAAIYAPNIAEMIVDYM